jgi:alkyldihydroxyacetonephosphate synthase
VSNEIYDHKWGYKDTEFQLLPDGAVLVTGDRYDLSGTEMPGLMPFVEEMLGLPIDTSRITKEVAKKPVAPPNRNEGFCTAVTDTFPAAKYTFDDRIRLIHSHGQTTAEELYQVYYKKLPRTVDMVFYVETEEDAQKIIQLAVEHDVCLVPYGGGTSVSGALVLPMNEKRMIVALSMMRLKKIEWIDRENMQACVQAGITGTELEDELAKHGLTSGHEPDSIELSTLGGWIATNASGMKKNRYGNIEDIVENVTMITPTGIIEQLNALPRVSMGMQLQNLLFGSEGNLGLITKAVIKVHKLPEVKKYGSFVFRNWDEGVAFLHELMRTGVLPASVRLVDNIQFRFGSALKGRPSTMDKVESRIQKLFLGKVKGFKHDELVAATVVMEGKQDEVAYQNKVITRVAKQFGGIAGGEANGKRGYMLTYAIAYIRDFFAQFDVLGETYETTVPWSKIHDVCEAVAERAMELHKQYKLPGMPYVSPRVTQLYHSGVCIYFTHAYSARDVEHPDEIFATLDYELRKTIMANGGSISHHHGVGKIRKDFMDNTISPATAEVIKKVKEASDPQNIFGVRNNVFAAEEE